MGTGRDAAELAAALARARSVRVVAGSSFDSRRRKQNFVLAGEQSQPEVARLVAGLAIDEDGERSDWMTMGGPTAAFHDDEAGRGKLLAVVTCIGQDHIRSPLLNGDAPLADGGHALAAWMEARDCRFE